MQVANDTLIPNGPVSLTTSWASEALLLDKIYMASISLVFSGTPSGGFTVQCSNDKSNPINWTTIDGSLQNITAAGDHTYNIEDMGFKYIRVVYTYSGGSGTLESARYTGKGV
jgi:hypothetical protein